MHWLMCLHLTGVHVQAKSAEDVEKYMQMFSEVQQVVDSKQLHPMIRTQYMRTAFQIPYDASVRISLDTNLTMIRENPEDGPLLHLSGRLAPQLWPLLQIVTCPHITKYSHKVSRRAVDGF